MLIELRTRLRTRLVLLALIAVLPALAATLYGQWAERRHAHEVALQDTLRLTRLAANQEAAVLIGAEWFLQTLGQFPDMRSAPKDCNQLFASLLADHPGYLNLALMSTDGTVHCSSSPGSVGLQLGGRPWFQRAINARTTVVGEYQLGRTTGTPDIVIAYPLLDPQGHVDRILSLAMGLTQLGQFASAVRLPAGSTLTLFDRTRTVLARYPDAGRWVGKQVPETASVQHLLAGVREDVAEAIGVDGVRRLYVTVPVEADMDTGLYVGIGIEHIAVFGALDRIVWQQLVVLVLISLTVLAAALFGGNALVIRPIAAVSRVTARLAAGDLDARVQLAHGIYELNALGAAIDSMAEGLAARDRERTQTEGERQLLASIVESSDDAILSATLDGVILSWNAGAARLFGHTSAEAVGQRVSLIVPPDRSHELLALLARTERGEHVKHCETVRRRKDGSEVHVSLCLSPMADATGRIVGVSAIARDITEKRLAEEALRQGDERTRFALEASHVGIWEGRLQTDDIYWSTKHEAMHGLAPGTFGRSFQAFVDCIHPEDRTEVLATIDEAKRHQQRDAEFEYRTLWPDGSEHWIRATTQLLYDEAGQPVRGVGVAVDITDRRALEDQLRQAHKMEAVGQLAGGIAHDFNNMLTAILGNAEFVLDDVSLSAANRADVEEITMAARRAATLTHQLLAFSRKQILVTQVLHLGDVVSEVTPMLRRLIGESIDLKALIHDSGRVKADPGQMEQILMNLAVNARDAMPDGGRLTIETADIVLDDAYARQHPDAQAGRHVMLAVSDSGHGMDAATLRRIFEPFFTTKEQGQGTGLGLATVYGIAKQSGGHIWVYSEVGRGTTFKVYLPRTDQVADEPPPARVASRPVGGHETILVVEDEDVVRDFVSKVLTRQGYLVHAVSHPQLGIEFGRVHTGTLHLILSDVVLPEMSGRAMVAELQKVHAEAKVLYMSGYTDDAIVHHGVLDAGMWFLQKPFTTDALLARVRNVIDAPVTAIPTVA